METGWFKYTHHVHLLHIYVILGAVERQSTGWDTSNDSSSTGHQTYYFKANRVVIAPLSERVP